MDENLKDYAVVDENGMIVNMVVCDSEEVAEDMGFKKLYARQGIGDFYIPNNETLYLKARLEAEESENSFLEECILQLATDIYNKPTTEEVVDM